MSAAALLQTPQKKSLPDRLRGGGKVPRPRGFTRVPRGFHEVSRGFHEVLRGLRVVRALKSAPHAVWDFT